jgi:hypothetical protein
MCSTTSRRSVFEFGGNYFLVLLIALFLQALTVHADQELVPCGACQGTGVAPDGSNCTYCRGAGKFWKIPCRRCNQSGLTDGGGKCENCGGNGWVKRYVQKGPPPPPHPPPPPATTSGDCFIATAAFGSPLEPEVRKLRSFREAYLLPNGPGRWLAQNYHRYSPPVAHYISERPGMKGCVRCCLYPAVVVAGALTGDPRDMSLLAGGLLVIGLALAWGRRALPRRVAVRSGRGPGTTKPRDL